MDTPDIKAGTYYNLKLLCVLSKDKLIAFETPSGRYMPLRQCDLESVTPIPSEPPTLGGPTPKYDPCRKFRKGDKVRLIKWNGRNPFDTHHGLKLNPGEVHIVLDDEYERNEVYIGMSAADEEQSVVHSCNLELITPVEELEPYIVEKSNDGSTIVFTVKKRDCSQGLDFRYCPGLGGNIFFSEKHCRKHAAAECARLNEEYRKEQTND